MIRVMVMVMLMVMVMIVYKVSWPKVEFRTPPARSMNYNKWNVALGNYILQRCNVLQCRNFACVNSAVPTTAFLRRQEVSLPKF
jgi:hypothetical protein